VDWVVGVPQLADGGTDLGLVGDDGVLGGEPFVLDGLGGGDTLGKVQRATGPTRPGVVGLSRTFTS